MKLWLFLTAAFLSAVSATHLTSMDSAGVQQDDSGTPGNYGALLQQTDDYSDRDVEIFANSQKEMIDQESNDKNEVFLQGDEDNEQQLDALFQQGEDEDREYEGNQPVFMSQDEDGLVLADKDGGEEEWGDGTVTSQWNNRWDGPLRVVCPPGQGLYRVYSVHHNGREDRLFQWYCKPVRHYYYHGRYYYYHGRYLNRYGCQWKKINHFDQVMNYRCPTHSYLTGLTSIHNNHREDREWNALCCRTRHVCMRNCRWSGFINKWDAVMRFSTGGIMTGLYSYHSNHREDRRWKVYYCHTRRC